MDSQLLRRYLDGNASESERSQCEKYLSDPDAIVELGDPNPHDSLLDTLRLAGQETEEIVATSGLQQHLESLVQKIERLASRNSIGPEELKRILDPAEGPEELGRLGRFRVLEFIAGGGMGLVFRAIDPDLDRPVCIKVMNPLLASRGDAKQRFEREAKAAARLQHERIVTVFEVGEFRDLPFLVMELLDGESLRQRLNRQQQLTADEATHIVRQVAEGLRYAHEIGFLHRDIKPDNIWLTPDENVKLLDFGLARALDDSIELTQSGAVVGTPRYMSPEQVQSQPLQPTSDLFSLGIVLYEMLTGRSPFERSNVFSTLMSVANDAVVVCWDEVPSPVPQRIQQLVSDLLSKDPSRRPETAADVIGILQASHDAPTIASQIESDETPSTRVKPGGSRGGTGRFVSAVAGLSFGFVVFALAFWIYQKTDKGTLVVEADPSVEINVKNEKVNVHDPVSEKTYSVAIGSQPLPSGVYQLEIEDRESGLILSSQIVTIRRNQDELVTISLRDNESLDGQPKGSTEPNPLVQNEANEDSNPLASLVPMDAENVERALGLRSRDSLSHASLVSMPQPIPGVRSWSLEPTYSAGDRDLMRLSRDGQRVAQSADDGYVRIFDANFNLKLMIPVTDRVADIAWSPDPDVLLVVCQGRQTREALLWRIKDDRAELLQRIPVEASKAVWSRQGDRIAFKSTDSIRFYDVPAAKVFAISGSQIRGQLFQSSWSPDGQLLATTEDDSVKIWSLADGSVYHVFPGASKPKWLAGQGRIAIHRSNGTKDVIEIWSIDELAREKAISIPAKWIEDTVRLNHKGDQIAALTASSALATGTLTDTDLDAVTEVDATPGTAMANSNVLNNLSQVEISEDGRRIFVKLYYTCVMFERSSDGTLAPLARRQSFGQRWLPALSTPVGEDHVAGMMTIGGQEDSTFVKLGAMNLADLKLEGSGGKFNGDSSNGFGVDASMSSDHRYAVVRGVNGESLNSVLVEIASGEIRELSGPPLMLLNFEWTRDGRFAVAAIPATPSRSTSRSSRSRYSIIDTVELTHRIVDNPTVGSVRSMLAARTTHDLADDRLWMTVCSEKASTETSQRSNPVYDWEVRVYDLATLELERTINLGSFFSVDALCVLKDQIVWFGNKTMVRTRALDSWSAFAIGKHEQDATSMDYVIVERAKRITPSHDGRFLLFHRSRSGRKSSYDVLSTEDLFRDGTTVATAKPVLSYASGDTPPRRMDSSPDLATWHTNRNQIATIKRNAIQIHDLDDATEFEVLLGTDGYRQAVPASFGWILQTNDKLRAFDFEGQYLGCWLGSYAMNEPIAVSMPNRWVRSNGATKAADDRDQVCLVQLRGNQVITTIKADEGWKGLPEGMLELLQTDPFPWKD